MDTDTDTANEAHARTPNPTHSRERAVRWTARPLAGGARG